MSINPNTIQNFSSTLLAPFYFAKQKNGSYLITNEFGYYSFLSEWEFEDFCTGKMVDGAKFQELEKKLFVKNENYLDKAIVAYNKKNQFLAFWPALHIIVMTLRCTHKCQYCHAAVAPMTAKDLDMTRETAEKVVDTIFFSSSPWITIEFQWGESMVNWDVLQFIVEYARMKATVLGKWLTFALVSNLSLMDEEKLQWLLDNGVDICTSLDGDRETHNRQRIWKDGDSFENVTHWIHRINEEHEKRGRKGYTIGALATWTKKGLGDYKKIIDSYIDAWLTTIGVRWLNPYGFAAAEKQNLEFSLSEYISLYRNSMDYILEKNRQGIVFKEMLSIVFLNKILNNTDSAFMDVRSPSGAAIGYVAYNYDGKVYSGDDARMLGRMGIDDFLLTPLLDTGEETYKAMANSPVTKTCVQASTLDGLPWYVDHVYKPYLGVDLVYSFTQYGNLFSNLTKDDKVKMQMAILDYLFEKLQESENEKIFRSWVNP